MNILQKQRFSALCLAKIAKKLTWSEDQKDKIFSSMSIVPTFKDVWSELGENPAFANPDSSRFGQVIISGQDFAPSLSRMGEEYIIRDNKSLFPEESFSGMTVLEAICGFVVLIDELNHKSFQETGKEPYFVPGLEFCLYFIRHWKTKSYLEDGLYYFFPGANFRGLDGSLLVPCSKSLALECNASKVDVLWNIRDRFVILEIVN